MKKLLLIVVLAGLALGTQARKVMFRVDMTGQTVGANGVHMPGNFKDVNYDGVFENPNMVNWDAASNALTDPDADNIYTVVLDLAPSLVYEFKFINGNDWPFAENAPAISQVGGGNSNRWSWVNSTSGTDTLVLPAIRFGQSAPAGMKAIRFRVNMSLVTAVSTNGVHVAGDFQGWDPSKSRMLNYAGNGAFTGNVYEHIGYAATGATGGATEYKFVNDNAWGGAENVPSSCAVSSNRTFGAFTNDSVLNRVCFSSCDDCPSAPLPVYDVTFRVDLSNACEFDSVDVAGGKINNWAGGTILKPISAGSKIYSVTVPIDSGEVEYKFRKLIAGNPSWEGVANRKQQLSSDTVLTLVCFDKETACGPVVAPADVRFVVDLSNEIPDPNGDVFIMGNFTQPNWQSGAIKMTPVVGQIGMYETTFNMCPPGFAFQFSNGPVSNNANVESFSDTSDRGCVVNNGVGGWNRTYERADANVKTVAFVFNTCTAISFVGLENNKLESSAVRMFPNPSSESTTIEFNDNATAHQVTVTDVTGRVVAKYSNVSEKSINVNTQNLNAGFYFVTIQNDRNEYASLKLMVR
jgi:hypothetical protein